MTPYEEGRLAYEYGIDIRDNPYETESRAMQWENGWHDADEEFWESIEEEYEDG